MTTGIAAGGLRYVVRQSARTAAWCALAIRCGSRDEGDFPEGIAHFTEHAVFKGTRTRSATAINNRLDSLGGELNAYTTKEEIVFHATVLGEDIRKAIELLLDLATNPSFPEKEVLTEQGVVLDEILSCKDSPADDIYDRFEEMLFAGHPLARSILGNARRIKTIQSDTLHAFVRERFHPGRMFLSVVAPQREDVLVRTITKEAARFFPEGVPEPAYERSLSPSEGVSFDRCLDKRHHEANLVLGCTAPSLYEERERYAAALLANILGGPAGNSLLGARLRERYGWCYGVECIYTPYADSGVFAISLGCEKENLDKCRTHIDRVLERVRTVPFSERSLRAAKKQMLGQLAIAADNGESQCLSLAKSLMAFGDVPADGETRRKIEAVTAADLLEMARRLCDPARLSKLVYL